MNKKILWLMLSWLIVAALVLASCGEAAPGEQEEEEEPSVYKPHEGPMPSVWKAGGLYPMTGPGSYWGDLQWSGAEMAVREINRSGDLPFKIELIKGDHGSDNIVMAASAARKMVDVDKVQMIQITWYNTITACTPIVQQNQVVGVISGTTCTEEQVKDQPFIYNTRLLPAQTQPVTVEYLVKRFNIKKLALVYWQSADGVEGARVAKGRGKELGVDVVYEEGVPVDWTDFRSTVAKIKVSDADAVIIVMVGTHIGYFVKQAREAGLTIPFMSIDYNEIDIYEAGGEAFEGFLFSSDVWSPLFDNPFNRQFIKTAHEEFGYDLSGTDINCFTAYTYEGFWVIIDTIKYVLEQGGDPFDGNQLSQAIEDKRFYRSLFPGEKMEITPDITYKSIAIYEVSKDGSVTIIDITTGHLEPWREE